MKKWIALVALAGSAAAVRAADTEWAVARVVSIDAQKWRDDEWVVSQIERSP